MNSLKQLLILCALVIPFSISAQMLNPKEISSLKKWKLVQFNFGLGADNDHYNSMSFEHLMAMAKDPTEMQRDLSGLDEEINTMTAGAALYANLGFSPIDHSTGTYRDDRELQLGVGIHFPKEAMVSFKNELMDTSIVYCNLQTEFTLDAAYLFKGRWGKKFQWYAGLGMNGGASTNNKMILISGKYLAPGEHPSTLDHSIEETYEAKSVFYSRLYVPYGIHYSINKQWQIGFDFRTGVGAQFIQDERPDFIRKTGAFVIGARYRI